MNNVIFFGYKYFIIISKELDINNYHRFCTAYYLFSWSQLVGN